MDADYLTPEQVGVRRGNNRNSLCFVHSNARSARNKEEEILALHASFGFDPDVLMITEPWYQNGLEVLKSPGYTTYFLNRASQRGGGVLLMIENTINCSIVESRSAITCDYEILTVQYGNTVFCVLYRPPNGNHRTFMSFLDDYLGWINDCNHQLILGGDLNIDLLTIASLQTELCRCLMSNGFRNVINAATRVCGTSATLIDVFITNIIDSNLRSGIVIAAISDHLLIFIVVKNLYTTPVTQNIPINIRDINARSLEIFRLEIMGTYWSEVRQITDPEIAYDCFYEKFKTVYDRCFPYKTIKRALNEKNPG
ncbi:hypothetical protein HPB48_016618 [Haemaphysalis longicornis]|uniref:Endonuclease/exonuclease/phosphatase domain-containing protein n=1 Tax=Haemaphysalis longicornis TaxID=44386 RepID=A0A9J6FPJ7_HAELO|nr:hypothetical protein HPB48_016618 [Haemaphysalis longicornis]